MLYWKMNNIVEWYFFLDKSLKNKYSGN